MTVGRRADVRRGELGHVPRGLARAFLVLGAFGTGWDLRGDNRRRWLPRSPRVKEQVHDLGQNVASIERHRTSRCGRVSNDRKTIPEGRHPLTSSMTPL